jgi:hypothetical protein
MCVRRLLRVQTATYSFVFPNSDGEYQRVFLPLLDLVNHAGEGANAAVYKDERGEYSLTALRDIRCGRMLACCRTCCCCAMPHCMRPCCRHVLLLCCATVRVFPAADTCCSPATPLRG